MSAEQEYRQQLEKSKKELVKKLAIQIKSVQTKEPANFSAGRAGLSKLQQAHESLKVGGEAKRSWLSKLMKNKAAALEQLGEKLAGGRYLAPMNQETVGERVEDSLGPNFDQFGSFQGALHQIIQTGVGDDALDQFFFDEEEERVMTTYQKWQIIRHAAEQVLAVYANRSNSQWIEDASWAAPHVINTTAASASVYSNAVDAALTQGSIALFFIDDGRMSEMGGDEVSPLVATDLWQAIKEMAPNKARPIPGGWGSFRMKVPSGQRLERLSVAGRHLLHAAVSVEMWYGAVALRQTKVVLAIDCECEYFVVNELAKWNFFGLHHSNVVLLPLPRFHGFAQDMRSGHLAHVKGSSRLMLGTGYAMFLLNSPAEAYTLSADGSEPQCLQGSVLEWLLENKASWLYTGLFSDVERLRPEALFDMDFLAAGLAAVDRMGANMAVEVAMGEREREARLHDSLVLARGSVVAASAAAAVMGTAAASGGGDAVASGAISPSGPTNCNLRPSSMRTVKSYKLLQTTASSPHGFYIATHRYVFNVRALQGMLVDPAAFHADVYLQDFYAYATFDISDLTTFRPANCACILGTQGLKAPVMSEVIYGKEWLAHTATILQLQDGIKEFRRKAVELYDHAKMMAAAGPALRTSTFKEKQGYNVLLVLTPDHGRLVKPALRMARLFVHNVVDRLHVYLMVTEADSKTRARELLDQVTDKELEFHQQLIREVVVRPLGVALAEAVQGLVPRVAAKMLVVPSERLCVAGAAADLGQLAGSSALSLAKSITSIPLLIVKANTMPGAPGGPAISGGGSGPPSGGRSNGGAAGGSMLSARGAGGTLQKSFSTGGQAGAQTKDALCAMVHLDSTSVGPLVEFVSGALTTGTDSLYLVRSAALERDGQLTMRSRRVFVQARMSVAQALRVEERAYAGSAAVELPKAVDTENVDLLALSCPADMIISKDTEQLLTLCRTSILVRPWHALSVSKGGITPCDASPAGAVVPAQSSATRLYDYGWVAV
ncbi:hypothetical protein VOLCADRAFT_119275 [Volvox carteri f. nagariensis]|uniref:Uncharacterized protein n=1 Tax=Volvox carteri f. nagariensis TaxID=3068 RepID=D8UBQ9_VOLCA|nr:uncharacterized protein VOLCADRAFT_119275 [Volvox carteri f. nagariensis]EFJ42867.1 hypothetical protein VOLCADRAFT_119275 [Volvox carteri f. nagariensis]|eukprot:XP_002956127.1 hypothetical protein VOLCADRAFT_119275 [Volvox carteri f. nagariensis]